MTQGPTLFIPRSQVARELGIGSSTLSYHLRKHQIQSHRFGHSKELMLHRETVTFLREQGVGRKKRTAVSKQEQAQHDGILSADADGLITRVSYWTVWSNAKQRDVQGIQIADQYDRVPLTPAEALSLLAWLEQEQENLQRLVQAESKGETP